MVGIFPAYDLDGGIGHEDCCAEVPGVMLKPIMVCDQSTYGILYMDIMGGASGCLNSSFPAIIRTMINRMSTLMCHCRVQHDFDIDQAVIEDHSVRNNWKIFSMLSGRVIYRDDSVI